jgi:hypothetical protein
MSPIMFIAPLIGFAAFGWLLYNRKTMGATHDAQHTQFRAGELANRLGLALVKGDPSFNLFIAYADAGVRRGPTDDKPVNVDILMQGAPNGLQTELVYLNRIEQETEKNWVGDVRSIKTKTWFDCHMAVFPKSAIPAFEVISRKTPIGKITHKTSLPEQATGNPAMDAKFIVKTHEPRLAAVMGEHLSAFATFDNAGVHLVGNEQSISYVLQSSGAPLLANALYYAEIMSKSLSDIARAVGG